jgi:hypothetical protein
MSLARNGLPGDQILAIGRRPSNLGNRWWIIVPTCNGLGSVIARSWAIPYPRRTSSHEPGNRYVACRVMLAPFLLTTPPLRKSRAHPPLRSWHTIAVRTPSSTEILQSSSSCARFFLETQRHIPLYSSHLKASSSHPTSP